jgi:ATP-dependent Clp protease ATP-binding subunit ClpA
MKEMNERATAAIERAKALAKDLGDACVATGHLVYGVTGDHLSIGNRIFNDINIYPEMFRDHLKKLPRETNPGTGQGFHALVDEVMARARKIRSKLQDNEVITTDHLLLALLSLDKGSAYDCLKEFSVEPDEILIEMLEALGYEFDALPVW